MISVIIPTFGDFKRVDKLLHSIRSFEASSYEVIIVNDNPKILRTTPPHLTIQNTKNLGFAASVNKGLAAAKGDILLVLNDDVVFIQPVFSQIEAEFDADPYLGVLGATLLYPNKAVQHAGMKFDHKSRSFYHVKNHLYKNMFTLAVTGAFFAISRRLYAKRGGLDERYFLACEDTQYCLRAWMEAFKVKVSRTIKAIHEEGATRGRTPEQKKKHKAWTEAEALGIKNFKLSLDLSRIRLIESNIRALNQEKIRIEVGSGYNPQPGYKHLDIRRGLPQLDYVCDFVKEPLPFQDGEVSEILANHVIEHIPFRKLPFVIGEWSRVLEVGGKLTLRTPNLKFICERYLRGETTPEWPGDETFIKENLSSEVTPSWWANLKLFSGQDYPANFHHVCFDEDMLRSLLARYDFINGQIVDLGKEYSPGELQFEAYKGD